MSSCVKNDQLLELRTQLFLGLNQLLLALVATPRVAKHLACLRPDSSPREAPVHPIPN
ncbi:hypothetical protein TorRG33x02_349760, partial [Trema orientale]